jgi:cytidylate kinase
MTDYELLELRAKKWRTNGEPIRTLEDAQEFIESVGFCVMYPLRPPVFVPTFIGAFTGTDQDLPTWQHAFADPRAQQATELMVRLLRQRSAYEANPFGETNFLVAASVFAFFYGVVGDRNPRRAPKVGSRSEYSPLAVHAFQVIQEKGPISKPHLKEILGGDLSTAALDRALNELWARLRITRVDYKPVEGAFWDVLFRWSPEPVREGMNTSVAEALTALVSKYMGCVIAAEQSEVEEFFSNFIARSRVREAINALIAARELSFVHIGNRSMLECTPPRVAPPVRVPRPPRSRVLPTLLRPRTFETTKEKQASESASTPARKLVIAIDGPAGAGKSTIASRLARKLGYINLESGAMYRALGLKALEQGTALDSEAAMIALANCSRIELIPAAGGNCVLLDGRDVSTRIRERDVTDAASRLSVHPAVREWMVTRQREMGVDGGVIMEGRDIGTVVFPSAEVKIFLDADPDVRANRRILQHDAAGDPEKAARLKAELHERDQRDSTRAAAPLAAAPDAVHIDSSSLNIEQVIVEAERIVDDKLAALSRK